LGPEGREQLTDLMYLPASYGGGRLQSFDLSAGVEFLGSFAGIAAFLISFCRKTELHIYIRIAEAQETLDDNVGSSRCNTVEGIKEVNDRISTLREPLFAEEVTVATQLV